MKMGTKALAEDKKKGLFAKVLATFAPESCEETVRD